MNKILKNISRSKLHRATFYLFCFAVHYQRSPGILWQTEDLALTYLYSGTSTRSHDHFVKVHPQLKNIPSRRTLFLGVERANAAAFHFDRDARFSTECHGGEFFLDCFCGPSYPSQQLMRWCSHVITLQGKGHALQVQQEAETMGCLSLITVLCCHNSKVTIMLQRRLKHKGKKIVMKGNVKCIEKEQTNSFHGTLSPWNSFWADLRWVQKMYWTCMLRLGSE